MNQRRALIVIVNYNGRQLLRACLRSLKPELSGRDDVLVVDNGSTDGSQTLLLRSYPWAKRIELERNTGFTGGNNAALRFVEEYKYFILLNNDIEVEPGFLEALLAPFKLPGVGQVNAIILDAEGKRVDHAGGRWLFFPSGTNIGAYRNADPQQLPDEVFDTTYASGAAVAVPTSLLQGHGLFPDFFAYYEDVDLSWRLRRANYRIVVAPKSRVRHLGSATSGRNRPLFEWYAARNRIFLFRRNLAWWQKPVLLPLLALSRIALALPSLRTPALFRARITGLVAGLFGRLPA